MTFSRPAHVTASGRILLREIRTMIKMMIGLLAAMVFVLAVQAQAEEESGGKIPRQLLINDEALVAVRSSPVP